jgi:ATP-binding cassette subfamily F protein 3
MIRVSNLSKNYGRQVLFDEMTFSVDPGERLGVVGRNGHGKSTLFRMLLGEDHPDSGEIFIPRGYRLGHLSQHLTFTENNILSEVCLALPEMEGGWKEEYKAEEMLAGLGFSQEDLYRYPGEFSGGYQIRLNLAKLLLAEPNLLLLDEPTNYLDIVAVRWLKQFLRQWKGEVMIITHDREFMDSISTHTLAIHRQKARKMSGGTQKMYSQIIQEEEIYAKTITNDAKRRKDIENFVARFRATASKAKAVQSRVKLLEKMEVKEELAEINTLDFSFRSKPFPGKYIAEITNISFGYNETPLLENLSFAIGRNDRIGIIGQNGKGKSTLLSLIAGERPPTEGVINISPSASLAYFGQTNIQRLNLKHTVEEEMMEAHPEHSRGVARSIAGLMMFEGDFALKKIDVLSGGERSRVLLGKILLTPANCLLLDEPTNHLDMESINSLVEAIDEFPGAVVIVTHSEEILRRVANRLIVFDRGKVLPFEGDYNEFLRRVGWEGEEK